MLKAENSGDRDEFLKILQMEARWQSKLSKNQLVPGGFGWLGQLVGSYPWQSLLLLSIISAAVLNLLM